MLKHFMRPTERLLIRGVSLSLREFNNSVVVTFSAGFYCKGILCAHTLFKLRQGVLQNCVLEYPRGQDPVAHLKPQMSFRIILSLPIFPSPGSYVYEDFPISP